MSNVLGTLNPGWWFSKKRISFDSMVLLNNQRTNERTGGSLSIPVKKSPPTN